MIRTGVQLTKTDFSEIPDMCIICQKNEKTSPVSYESGKARIREVATILNDAVFLRLQKFGENFVYHTGNKCYKSYTHKKKKNDVNVDNLVNNNNTTQRQSEEQYHSEELPYNSKCVICNRKTHQGITKKSPISEYERARKFLEAKVYFEDDVNLRTANVYEPDDVLNAKLYCHKNCVRSYLRKYEDSKNNKENATASKGDLNRNVILTYVETLIPQMKSGLAFPLTDIRNNIKLIHKIDVSNRYIKKCMSDKFGNELLFSSSRSANKSDIVYHSSIKLGDVTDFLRSKDDMKDCGRTLRELCKVFDFGLSDEFSDATNLETAWNNIRIPLPALSFFGELLNFKPEDFECLENECDLGDDADSLGQISHSKRLKVLSLFQIICYMISNGTKKTPMHIMSGLAVHDACKSSILIESFNHIGVSVSYDEVLRHRNDLSRFTILKHENNVPIPSHFDRNMFTLAAFDNFDHNESTFTGLGSSHDTVCVLFQDKPEEEHKKPKLSEVSMKHGGKILRKELGCQKIQQFSNPSKTAALPQDYTATKELPPIQSVKSKLIEKKEFAWEFCRFDQSQKKGSDLESCLPVPTWGPFNSFILKEKKRPTQIVGFLPIIPKPVTEYSTVYTALQNFVNVLSQLHQSKLPVACDEGVYHIARHIMLLRPDEFKDIVLMMGSWHLTKIVLQCIGKYLKGSGADLIFSESSVFGPTVTESVLNGTNYARSMKAYIILSETLRRLQLKEFFKEHDIKCYTNEINKLKELQECFAKKDFEQCKKTFEEYTKLPNNLQTDFEKFICVRRSESQTFKYWDNVIYLISLAKCAVRADREGDWTLHLSLLPKILPIFNALNRPNYLRWCALYYEDMLQLEITAPEVYAQFLDGKFAIKRTARCFSSVGADLALEQTINKSKKSSHGVIGKTRSKAFVAEWDLIYHEVLAVTNLYRDITKVQSSINYELKYHHEYTSSETENMEHHITSMEKFILQHDNPFGPGAKTLRNIITQEEVCEEFRDKILDVVTIGNYK